MFDVGFQTWHECEKSIQSRVHENPNVKDMTDITDDCSADVLSQQWVCRSDGYLRLEALLHLPELSLLFICSNLHHILLLIDPVPPVLLATLLQQSHSDGGREQGKVTTKFIIEKIQLTYTTCFSKTV